MIILGLTGSIGMGKSTATAMFRRLRVPVFDADAAVHALQGPGGRALPAIEAAFPGTTGPTGLDRQKLGAIVFADRAALKRLEAIIHPMLNRVRRHWLSTQALHRQPLVVLDVPLLFETGGDRRCDAVAVVSAPAHVQRQRVLARPGMTAEKFAHILKTQLPDAAKRRRADFVIPSGQGKLPTLVAIRRLLRALDGLPARHWPPGLPGGRRPGTAVIRNKVRRNKVTP